MQIFDYFLPPPSAAATDLFSQQAMDALSSRLSEKNGKPHLQCQVRKKSVLAKPEEIVRQFWLYRLIHHYGYPVGRLQVEYPITFGRDTSKRADIVIFDADRPTTPYLIVEVKERKQKDGKEQLKSYTHATGAPLALWSNGEQAIVWHRKNPNYLSKFATCQQRRRPSRTSSTSPGRWKRCLEKRGSVRRKAPAPAPSATSSLICRTKFSPTRCRCL